MSIIGRSTVKLSSLRETLLKAAALNFENIFLNNDRVRGYVLKKDIHLPPNLFEDIQSTGSEIGWPIPDRFLRPCLAFRDALNWVNVDLLLGYYKVKDLVKIKKSRLPLKKFSVRVHRVTSKLMFLIRKYCRTLVILHVGRHRSSDEEELRFRWFKKPLKFHKLKKLIIDFDVESIYNLLYIDLSFCSETLESLEFNSFDLNREDNPRLRMNSTFFSNTFNSLYNLKSLTLFRNRTYKYFENSKIKFKNLRSLCTHSNYTQYCDEDIEAFVKNMDYLEYLDIESFSNTFMEGNFEFLKSKNLKYLGLLKKNKPQMDGFEKLAKTVYSNLCDVESLVTCFELYIPHREVLSEQYLFELIIRFTDEKQSATDNQWQRIGMIILVFMQKYWTNDMAEIFLHINMLFKIADVNHRWSKYFMGKFANLIVNFAFYKKMDPLPLINGYILYTDIERNDFVWVLDLVKSEQLLNFMLEYITSKPYSTTGKMYLNFLMLSNIYRCYDIDSLEFFDMSTSVKVLTLEYSETQVKS